MTSHLNLYFHTSSCTLWVIQLILLFCCCDQTPRIMEETCREMRPSWQEAWQQVAGMATGTGSGEMTSTANVKQEEWGGSGSRLYNTQSPPLAMYFLQQAVLSQNCIPTGDQVSKYLKLQETVSFKPPYLFGKWGKKCLHCSVLKGSYPHNPERNTLWEKRFILEASVHCGREGVAHILEARKQIIPGLASFLSSFFNLRESA